MSTTATSATTKNATTAMPSKLESQECNSVTVTETKTKTRTIYLYSQQQQQQQHLQEKNIIEITSEEAATTLTAAKASTNAKNFLPQLLRSRQSQSRSQIQNQNQKFSSNANAFRQQPLIQQQQERVATRLTARNLDIPTIKSLPLFEVKLELLSIQIQFQPTFMPNVENNFQQIVEQLLQDIRTVYNSMPRIVLRDDVADNSDDNNSTTPSSDDEFNDADIYLPHENQNKKVFHRTTATATKDTQKQGKEQKSENQIDKKLATATTRGIFVFYFLFFL